MTQRGILLYFLTHFVFNERNPFDFVQKLIVAADRLLKKLITLFLKQN